VKALAFALAALMLLACSGCGAAGNAPREGQRTEPPDLTVRAGEAEITSMRLSYYWAIPLGNGEVMHQAAQAAAPEDVLDILPSLPWAAAFELESLLDARILTAELWPAARGSVAAAPLTFDGLTLAPEAISEASVAVIQLGFEQGTCTYTFKIDAP